MAETLADAVIDCHIIECITARSLDDAGDCAPIPEAREGLRRTVRRAIIRNHILSDSRARTLPEIEALIADRVTKGAIVGPLDQQLPDGTRMAAYYRGIHLHREPRDGPALVIALPNGAGVISQYWQNGELHRAGHAGPAHIMMVPGIIEPIELIYAEHGACHRIDGPAVQRWHTAATDDGPVRRTAAQIEFFEGGKPHRDNAPAILSIEETGRDCSGGLGAAWRLSS